MRFKRIILVCSFTLFLTTFQTVGFADAKNTTKLRLSTQSKTLLKASKKSTLKQKALRQVKLCMDINKSWRRPYSESKRISRAIFKASDHIKKVYKLSVEPYEIAGIIAQESSFNPNLTDGLMQTTSICLQSVAKAWKVRVSSLNPHNIEQGVLVGSYYYARHKDKYGRDMSLVVYNRGFENSKRHLALSRSMPSSYMRRVETYMHYYRNLLK